MNRHGIALLAACAGASLISACGGGGTDTPPALPPTPSAHAHLAVLEQGRNLIEVYDYVTGALVTTIPVGNHPTAIAMVSPTRAYVTNAGDGTVSVVNFETGKVVKTLNVGIDPESVILAGGQQGLNVWERGVVANTGSNSLTVLDTHADAVIGTIPTGLRPTQLANSNDVAVLLSGDKKLVTIDPTSGATTATFALSGTPSALGRAGWVYLVADSSSGAMHEYTGQLPFSFIPSATEIATGTGSPGVRAIAAGVHTTGVANGTTHMLDFYSSDTHAYVGSSVPIDGTTVRVEPGDKEPIDANTYGLDQLVVGQAPDNVTIVSQNARKTLLRIALPGGSTPVDAVFINGLISVPVTVVPTAAPPAPTPTPIPTPVPTATPQSSSTLYVANQNGNNVLAFTSPLSGSSVPARTISYPSISTSVSTDGRGTIVVAANSTLYAYSGALTASSSPYATVYTGSPNFTAFDSAGNMYATTRSQAVYRFAAPLTNNESPTLLYVADHSTSIVFDGNNTMYVANSSGNIDTVAPPYASNSQTVVSPPASGAYLSGMAISKGMLYVADTANQSIYAYTLPLSAASFPTYTYAATDPEAIAFDAAGNLYVADDLHNSIDVYNAPSLQGPLVTAYTIGGAFMQSPYGLAVGP